MELLAKKKATSKIRFGVSCCFGQFFAMGWGIFYYSSWDVVEALTWCTSAFWLMIGAKLYLWKGIDMDVSAYESLLEQEMDKLKANANFDLEKEAFLESYISELKSYEEYLEEPEPVPEDE